MTGFFVSCGTSGSAETAASPAETEKAPDLSPGSQLWADLRIARDSANSPQERLQAYRKAVALADSE